MRKRMTNLADKMYRQSVSSKLEKACDMVNDMAKEELSSTLISQCRSVKPEMAGVKNINLEMTARRPWVSGYSHSGPNVIIADDNVLAETYETFVSDSEALHTEIGKARAEINATLDPIFTAKKLRAVWPECMSIADPILIDAGMAPKINPMVALTENLNTSLGLPADNDVAEEEQAAA